MQLKKDSSDQKLRGAYYTPAKMARKMISMTLRRPFNTVLEPSCGDGVFIEELLAHEVPGMADVTAIELDQQEANKVVRSFHGEKRLHVLCKDFFEFYQSNHDTRFDLIMGNPPYIRYQYLSPSQREVQSEILTSHGMKANRLINAWVAFLVACVHMLSDQGTIAFVIPAEILQVAYAEDLRLFLADSLDRITLITFKQLVFPDIEQEVLIFVGEKGSGEKGIRVIECEDIEDFMDVRPEEHPYREMSHVKEKWTKYFVNRETDILQSIREDSRFLPFSEYGLINVGITTGNNKYFSIDQQTEEEYDLKDVTLPLIGRSSHAHGVYFTKEDWEVNIRAGKRAMLVYFPEIPYEDYPQKHKQYIEYGEMKGENRGYKCSIRDRWYIVPSVWVPDAFFLRRNNLYPKFVLNRCDAVSTDTMHRMKFKEGVNPEDVLLSYYNSISFAFTEICGRSYGGGVLEILPGEMGKIMLPKIHAGVPPRLKKELLSLIDEVVREDREIEEALDVVDQRLLIEQLGIPSDTCTKCRSVWKNLQNRRLSRGG